VKWVIPDNAADLAGVADRRALVTALPFTIPITTRNVDERGRGLGAIAAAATTTVKTFFYKITDELLGPILHGFAKKWETQHRPSFTRMYGPGDYQNNGANFPRISDGDWRRLAQGRALLFVHGTFSTSGAFAALQPEVMAELSRRYGERVF